MKTVFIAYDQAHQVNVMEALNDTNARGYTILEQAGGRGTKGGDPHLGTHAWPSMNSAIITVVEDAQVGLKMHRWDLCSSVSSVTMTTIPCSAFVLSCGTANRASDIPVITKISKKKWGAPRWCVPLLYSSNFSPKFNFRC